MSREAREAIETVTWWLWRGVSLALRAMPACAAFQLATLAGAATFLCWPRGRRAATANATRLVGRRRAATVARRSLQNYCRYLVEFARMGGDSPEIPPVTRGLEHIDELKRRLAAGRGAILALTHSGNWDVAAAAAASAGVELSVVAETVGGKRLDADVRRARERLGVRVLKLGEDTMAMRRVLQSGGVLAILVDRPDPERGVPVTFFRQETRVPAGAARLALASGAILVPVACTRRTGVRREFAIVADFGIAAAGQGHGDDAATRLTQALFSAHERFIQAAPTQWYMFRGFWPATGQ